jgi:hypothetical protein
LAGDRLGEAMAWRALAGLEARAGRPARADHYLAMAARSAEIRGSRREAAENSLCAAALARARGDDVAAAALADTARREFDAMGMPMRAAVAAARLTSR